MNLLNLPYVNAVGLSEATTGNLNVLVVREMMAIVREMMTLYAVNLEKAIKKGDKDLAGITVNVPTARTH